MIAGHFRNTPTDMIETNPIRQRTAELLDRLTALRGYL
jgi:hypothetical protein